MTEPVPVLPVRIRAGDLVLCSRCMSVYVVRVDDPVQCARCRISAPGHLSPIEGRSCVLCEACGYFGPPLDPPANLPDEQPHCRRCRRDV